MSQSSSAGRRVILTALAVVVVLALIAGVGWLFVDPHRGQAELAQTTLPLDHQLSYEEAVADLDFVALTIEGRHVWTVGGLPDEVERVWQEQVAALPQSPAVVDVWRASERILVALGDGHTFSAALVPDEASYAVGLRMVDGEPRVLVDEASHPVTHVNAVAAADLVARNRALTPADNDGWVEGRLLERLRMRSDLALLGAEPEGDYVITYRDASGQSRDLVVEEGALSQPTSALPSTEYAVTARSPCSPCTPVTRTRSTVRRWPGSSARSARRDSSASWSTYGVTLGATRVLWTCSWSTWT